jgi:DNA-binding transcriptional regulator PaaX
MKKGGKNQSVDAQRVKGVSVSTRGRGDLTKHILQFIERVFRESTAAPRTIELIEQFNPEDRIERNKIWKTIKYLEEKNRIHIEERGDDMYVYLTAEGRIKLNEDAIWGMVVQKPENWDQKWRLVMFDFPAERDRHRHSFRVKLEDLGFKLYQRSVFIYPFECHEEVHTIAKWYGVDEYIRYIVATEVHDMRRFAKLFDLL